ncbi:MULTISPECIES: hypothetical protein [Olivibacter]|jgi:hypothetical protein|uniref:Uncharacterized protein n=3 Tax=Sphingobacteriaceae TaxID=84566 RepID=F4CB86_SPHS2|nr:MULTISPECIES: hypothetical protein [Olivibacter]MCL4637395.1 hypothetical protein [Olivibacter sp. UJ_SKK_5.1]MDM8173516.1 hypothetical protein [Olivibacter sp. 47]MDX3914606.1 hypothetical protein [Pseudosphingobacterium sp.]QEL03237.1 hypothetical protein FKG96_21235 [Olivibacter sp. LS-1]
MHFAHELSGITCFLIKSIEMEVNLDRKLIDELIVKGYTVLVSSMHSTGNYCLLTPKKWDLEAINSNQFAALGEEEIILLDDLLLFNCDEFNGYKVVN